MAFAALNATVPAIQHIFEGLPVRLLQSAQLMHDSFECHGYYNYEWCREDWPTYIRRESKELRRRYCPMPIPPPVVDDPFMDDEVDKEVEELCCV